MPNDSSSSSSAHNSARLRAAAWRLRRSSTMKPTSAPTPITAGPIRNSAANRASIVCLTGVGEQRLADHRAGAQRECEQQREQADDADEPTGEDVEPVGPVLSRPPRADEPDAGDKRGEAEQRDATGGQIGAVVGGEHGADP